MFFVANGFYEIILVVSNSLIEVTTTIFIEILNAPGIGLNEYTNQKQVVSISYFDLVGQEIILDKLNLNHIYIQQILYDNGSVQHLKMFKSK